MKKINKYIAFLTFSLLFASCNLTDVDNYDAPNASIKGGIYDIQTDELIEQDIVDGMQIEYEEHGFDNPHTQYMIVKNDGTYQNNLMFAATYSMKPTRGNFVPVEKQDITINKGENVVNFKVQPYIRIKNVTIEQDNERIVASFYLEQTVASDVLRATLFIHSEKNVGESLHAISAQLSINGSVDPGRKYMIEIDLDSYKDLLKSGKEYYFRVGALIDATEAKYNYAPTQKMKIEEYTPPTPGSNSFVLTKPIYIDFGPNKSDFPYNNYERPTDNTLTSLIDKDGNNSKFAIGITKGFSGENTLGVENNTLGWPASATGDSFWSEGSKNPESEFVVSNLNRNETYSFVFYGSRRDAGDNRETRYHVKGKNSGDDLSNTSSNSGDLAVVENIKPNEDGTITITLSAGPNNNNSAKYFYINTMCVVPSGYNLSSL